MPALVDAIRRLHKVDAKHVKTVRVRETSPTGTVWRGDVEVFWLVGHRKALKAYAWSQPTMGNGRRFYVVLHVGAIDSAAKAVQASIVDDAQKALSA
jgi:transposase InsO family protein